ncbi:hypothetical protein D3C80_405120 [compost metagenome]
MPKVGATNMLMIRKPCQTAAGPIGSTLQPIMAAISHRIGLSERRRLSTIFQRVIALTPRPVENSHGRSCQSPRAQR